MFLCCFALVCGVPQAALASVYISEIMYDTPGSDTGHEWIEIYNDDTSSVSIAGWRLIEGGTKHKITAVSGGDTLAPHAYAVIADNPATFRADNASFQGQLFDSAFNLSSSGETLSLSDAKGTTISSASYQGGEGAAGDGNSLNRNSASSAFTSHTPTPGALMSASTIAPPQKEIKTKTTKVKTKKETTDSKSVDVQAGADVVPVNDSVDATDTPPQSDLKLVATEEQTAAVGVFSRSALPWWAGAGAIAAAAGGALFLARAKKKDEWDIVEDSG